MFAVLHVADFSLQAVLRIECVLAGKAVALLDDGQRPPLVVACTPKAAAQGITPGLTSPQAMARCAEIILRTRQPLAETEARAGLLAAAFSISPQVEDTAPGVCTINVGGVAGERREPALRAALVQLRELGLEATAGLAETPLLALYAARYAPARRSLLPREAGQARVACIPRGGERSFLRDLPLAVAEPLPEIAAILASWGVRTLGELTALGKGDVTLRLGPAGLALWERAAGDVTRPLRLVVTPAEFSAELILEEEIETLEPLLFVLRRFIDRLALDLANAGFVAGEMILRLGLADETGYTRVFRLPEPTARPEILFRVLHTHLETLHTEASVSGLGLTCRPVRPLAQQAGLFESALRDPHGFSETLARVAAVVGPERLGTPMLENTHRPDAVAWAKPAAVVPPMAKADVHAREGLPLRRYRPPVAATVELNGAAPAFVWTERMIVGAVRAVMGPWCGSGDWWDASRAWRREEWDVELETGGVYRLLHLPEGWWVEGEYD